MMSIEAMTDSSPVPRRYMYVFSDIIFILSRIFLMWNSVQKKNPKRNRRVLRDSEQQARL